MNQKGFVNIIVIVLIVVLAGAVGYFALTKKSEPVISNVPPVTPSATSSNSSPNATSTGIPKVESPKKPVEQKSTYPFSKYLPLSSAKLEALRKLFIERNGSNWSIELDEFGFIRNIKTSDPSLVLQDNSTKYNFTDLEKSRWQQFILKNKDFFGIDDSSTFNLDNDLRAVQKFNGHSFWTANNEILSEYEQPITVFKSLQTNPDVKVFVDIQGHFWPKAELPSNPRLSQNDVERKFVGKNHSWQDVIHDPNHACDPLPDGTGCEPIKIIPHSVKIEKKDLDIRLASFLLKHGGAFELRLVYVTRLPGFPNGWRKFIDAMTGEELKSGL